MAAPSGGGGGGGPVGFSNSFTGPATSLELLGNFIYGYTGEVAIDNNVTDVIDFNTGNYVSYLNVTPSSTAASNDDYILKIKLNDSLIYQSLFSNTFQSNPYGYFPIQIIVPAYTSLKIQLNNNSGTTPNGWLISIVGEITK